MNQATKSPAPLRELVLASAGSGKTYHLSSRIIGLLASGTPPNEILASTFTRKAAGEILERVLVRLAEGASDPEKAQALGRDADPRLGQPEECRRLLARLLADLHQFNVGTLDAFLVRLARSFFQELGLAPGWTIADHPTQERLRTEAVQAALAGGERAELVELLHMVNRGDAERQVHEALLEKVDTLLRIRRQLDPGAVHPWSPDLGVTDTLGPEKLQAKASELAARLRELEVPTTKAGDPMKTWGKARDSASAAIAALDWRAVFGKGIGIKVLGGEDSFDQRSIGPDFAELFRDAGQLARIDLAPHFRRETEAMGRLAELLETAFEDAQRRARAYRFEDITYLLGGPDSTGGRDDLHYRLDQPVRHLLLDEFQDTSLEQWRALEPLAHKLLSGPVDGRAGIIVADTKQSIYGWRGARPELVRRVGKRYELAHTTLDKSWRSSAVVLEFVADVFRDLPTNTVVSGIPVGPVVASGWMEDFTELAAARDVAGHVRAYVAPDDTGTAAIQPRLLRHAAQIIKAMHDEMPGRSIGVLVRRNKVLGYLMDELRDLGVRASGEGGTSLTDTPPANALLSLLRMADHPQNRAARYHVTQTPLGEVVRFKDYKDDEAARTLAHRVRTWLLTDGYGPTLARWVEDLAPECDAREVMRLLQLVELGHRWDERATLRPADFARYVERESVEDPSSARVQVMTVHKSKGLEFDVVVLPELYTSLVPTRRGVAVPERDPNTGRVVQVYPRIPGELLPLFPEAENAEREVQGAELRDGLSVLYVALTRAKYAIHLVLPPEGGSARHSAGLIRAALGLEDRNAESGGVLLERGNPRWFEETEGEPEMEAELEPALDLAGETAGEVGTERGKAADPDTALLRPSTEGPGRNLARRSPSSLEGGTGVDLPFFLRLDAAPALARGQVVHAWCEEIEWIEDGIRDDDVLAAIARSTVPSMPEDQVAGLIAEFRGWMTAEPIRSALSRDGSPSDPDTVVHVENERPFVRRVKGEIQEGFIDRLVLIQRNGRVVRAEILDFKTDAIESGDEEMLAARTAHYRPQIVAYCDVVREQYALAEGDVSGRLLFLATGVTRVVV